MDAASNKTYKVKKLIYVGIVLIFIAHATITDAQSKSNVNTLEEIFGEELPKMALTQISDFILAIVDKILEVPSIWMMCLSPLFVWLTLHIDDGLFNSILKLNPSLQTELARLHNLTASQLAQYSRPLNKMPVPMKPGESRLDEHEKQADRQLHLLELMGTTLLFEENHLVGFLPLRSYLEFKKQLGAGKKCPPEDEDLVRCLLLRDCLERLKCTLPDIADRCDKISV